MFSMTKSRELDEVQTPYYFVNRPYYGENVKFYQNQLRDRYKFGWLRKLVYYENS